MSSGSHSAGSRPQAQGGVTAWKRRNMFIPAIPALLTSSRNKPVLKNILVNSNTIYSCAAKYLIDRKFRIQRNGCSADFGLSPGQPFPFTWTRERSFLLFPSGLVPRRGPSSGMPRPPRGPHSPWEELLLGWHSWAPQCHTGVGTPGSIHTVPALHRTSLCLSPSQPCPPRPCPCPPRPSIYPPRLKWKRARLSDHHTNSDSYVGQNAIVPSVKSGCFILGSIFSSLLRGGEERRGKGRRPSGSGTRWGLQVFF